MSSHRGVASTGLRAPPSAASPSSSSRPPSVPRNAGTPTKDAARGAHAQAGRAGAHASSSGRGGAAADADGGAELVAQLQERLEQLEDELKVSQDTAQWTIKQNKNTLLGLKQENKELSAEVARRGGSNQLQCKQGTATDGERAVERMERQVHELRRAYDKIIKDKKTALQKLDNLHDSLKDLAKVASAAAALPPDAAAALPAAAAALLPPAAVSPAHPSAFASGAGAAVMLNASVSSAASSAIIAAAAASLPANSPAARELRQLQNRLDKATMKANEAYSIRKTYEQVLEKLRAEEPLLEGRIKALQEQRATKQAALQTATLSGREVGAAKEAARAALASMEAEVAAGRARRAKVLAEMREKASTLQQTNRALLQRQFQPLGSAPASASASGAATPRSGAAAAGGPPPPISLAGPTAGEAEGGEDITARDLIVRLCRTTGARRVSELLARLLAQQESYARLAGMHSAAVAQKLALVQELEVLRSHRDELRGGGKLSTQKQMDAAQEELHDATCRSEAASASLEALLRGWAAVRGGLEHLAALVGPLPPPPGGPPAVPLEDETAAEVLAHIEQRLLGAYKLITSLPKANDMLESMYAAIRHEG